MPGILLTALGAAGCGGSTSERPDGGVADDASPEEDAGPTGCFTPDLVCPETHPHPGGPCEGALSCPYTEGGVEWLYDCHETGVWLVDAECIDDVDCTPPLAEACDEAFSGTLNDVTIDVGHGFVGELRPFEPFESDDEAHLVWGSQGLPMIQFRVRLTGIAPSEAPTCVFARTILSHAEEGKGEASVHRIALHCAESLGLYAVVPFGGDLACAKKPGTLDVEVELEIQGIGVITQPIRIAYREYEYCFG